MNIRASIKFNVALIGLKVRYRTSVQTPTENLALFYNARRLASHHYLQ